MSKVKLSNGSYMPIEMHRVSTVHPIRLIPVEDRVAALDEAGNCSYNLKSEDVFIDMLTDSVQDECTVDCCPLVCVLLWDCGRYHTARGAGCLCRFGHFRRQPDENRSQRNETGYCRIHYSVYLRDES